MREEVHTRLRVLLADLDQHLLALDSADVKHRDAAVLGTRDACAALAKTLDLGPEPPMRLCPNCRGVIAQAATLCMHCWQRSPPEH